jgi:hypothetical protein
MSDTSSLENQLQTHPAPWNVNNGSIPSRRRHIASNQILQRYQARPLVGDSSEQVAGISVGDWDIGTSQGPIANQTLLEEMSHTLEAQSQCASSSSPRKLALPEMIFPAAHIVLKLSDSKRTRTISWDAIGALTEWSQAHQHIPLDAEYSHRGVSVLKTSDANLWKTKKDETQQTVNSTEFHYDWTYSTPFCGNVVGLEAWKPLTLSGMPMHLLTDQTVPILYFDQIFIMEDDLHDNGLMQYSAKLRVMPTCVYVLSKLFVRIDHVLLRVRECRFLVDFGAQKLYRDITWRQCPWDELGNHGLPTDLRAWTQEGDDGGMEAPAFAMLQSKLPTVNKLPEDLMNHAECSYYAEEL